MRAIVLNSDNSRIHEVTHLTTVQHFRLILHRSPIAFTYGDYSKNSPYDPSYYYVSEGMQEPLKYVGDRAKVKMIVPFKRGAYNDQSNGQPVYYEILEYIFEENL